jgi:hypothetical protein
VTNLQSCDPAKSEACLGHLYQAPRNGNVYYLVVPGAGDTPYTQYVNSLKGDPTAAMMVTVSNDPGIVLVHGACNTELVMDDSDTGQHRVFSHSGTFDGRLSWSISAFRTETFAYDC